MESLVGKMWIHFFILTCINYCSPEFRHHFVAIYYTVIGMYRIIAKMYSFVIYLNRVQAKIGKPFSNE